MPTPLPIRLRPYRDIPERPGDLIEIVYVSDAEPSLGDDAIVSIIESAQDNNTEHDITGVLLYDGEHFLQVMEGDRRYVSDLYADILSDPRHRNVTTIHEGRIRERVFGGWGMAYRRVEEDSQILQLARRQMVEGRAYDPVLTDVGAWIAASLDPPDSFHWSSRSPQSA